MQAVGNMMRVRNTEARIAYVHSERFVGDMVSALQHNTINEFKTAYRTLDALLIDDIQFFAGQGTFAGRVLPHVQRAARRPAAGHPHLRSLPEGSRWSRGAVEVALRLGTDGGDRAAGARDLRGDSDEQGERRHGVELPEEVAFFIAKRIRSNVRELEGALRRVVANSQFTGRPITLDFAKEALKDLLALQDELVTIENIQKTVAEYYKIRVGDLLSKRRSRSIARPRQVAMALAKELTTHSLPEIGDAFGGRDHTTVLHACKRDQESARVRDAHGRGLFKPVENPYGMIVDSLCTQLWIKLPTVGAQGIHIQPVRVLNRFE